ncbi:feruloyl-CoA synthase [Caldimonas sp. KR1-144]|uniref:feruloyl-CoA synthase n=1 Tax=Caldimonas sp. KR1-144 TaxID=3400911 RepID=UPI003C09CA97
MSAWFDDPAQLAPPRAVREDLGGGAFVLRSPEPLGETARCIGEWLERWARETPEALFLAERRTDGEGSDSWRKLSYAQVRAAVGAIGQWLLDARLPAGKPVVILSDNAIDHALLVLACLHVGRPACTVSSAYSRLTKDYAKIRAIVEQLDPALIYASDAAVYGPAIAACGRDVPVVFSRGAEGGALSFEALLASRETAEVMQAYAAITPEHHAKYLLTSGSTGTPKVVINTHRMLCANQQMIRQCWRFLEHERPVVLDWLPWSHTFGANHNFHLVLANGGSLWIDDGRPMPGLLDKTVRNLREVRPTLYFNVPRGFDALAAVMEGDASFAEAFFARLKALFYAGAALPQSTWSRLEAIAARVRPDPVWFTSAWGSTETSPLVTSVHWRIERAGCIGLPAPGMALKFVPNGGKLEMRVRGPSVFPGYRNAPELTAKAFDDEGYYLIGDAGVLVDPGRPERGVAFDGRVAEDFKLTSGTWVSVGMLRLKVVSALAPLAQDVVVTGQDREEIGLLIFPTPQARELDAPSLAARVRVALQSLAADGAGSSQRATRALLLDEPPSAEAGEITDKGYLNQRAVLARRAALVEALYAGGAGVIHL